MICQNQLILSGLWLSEQYKKLRLDPRLDHLTNNDLKVYLLKKYDERRLVKGRLYNNATMENKILTQENFIDLYLNRPYILSGYACLFENQRNSVNISSAALENLGDMRKFNKKKMEAAEHGSDAYIYYRILQLTYKVLMNSYYGILGEKNSVFYNPFVQNSITLTGQDLITTSIIGMEAFMTNNVPFNDTDDVLTFILNIKNEDKETNILDYVDEAINEEDLVNYLCGHIKPEAILDRNTVSAVVSKLSSEERTRVYYKNQFKELLHNKWFKGELGEILKYDYIDKPADEIKDRFEHFKARIMEYVFYNNLYEDRYKRSMKDMRKCIITIDTDSNFINANKYVEQITGLCSLDKENTKQQTTVLNIIIDIVTEALKEIFWTLTTNMGLVDEAKPIINMKQEFAYSRILLTRNKKSYSGLITAELGHLLIKPVLDIKGLSIRKTTVPKKLRKEFTQILKEDVLESKTIDLKKILNKYDVLGESIEASLKAGETDYLLPKNLEVIESYKTPAQIEAVRAVMVWNALEPENQIVPPDKLDIIKLRADKADHLAEYLQDSAVPVSEELKVFVAQHPEKAQALARVLAPTEKGIDISNFGLSCIAIPKGNDKIPDYIIPFIDFTTMVNNNMTNGYIILESLGIYVDEVKTTKYKSNIIAI